MPKRLSKLDLFRQYQPLVLSIAGGFQRRLPKTVLREDVVAAAMVGLWDAIRSLREQPTDAFEWYVRVRVRGAIVDELRTQDWLPRRARARVEAARARGDVNVLPTAVVRFDDVTAQEMSTALAALATGETEVAAREYQGLLDEVVATLPERERFIVRQHYLRGAKFKDLGKQLGVSEPRISQLHARAVGRMRAEFKKRGSFE